MRGPHTCTRRARVALALACFWVVCSSERSAVREGVVADLSSLVFYNPDPDQRNKSTCTSQHLYTPHARPIQLAGASGDRGSSVPARASSINGTEALMEEALRARAAGALASHNYGALQQVAVALNGMATGRPPQAPQATAPSLFTPVKDWLWEHSEYVAPEFIRQYINCQSAVSSVHANVMMAQHQAGGRYKTQMLTFSTPERVVAPGNAPLFGNCNKFSFHMECNHGSDQKWFASKGDKNFRLYKKFHSCCVVVPYFHGIYQPSQTPTAKPWTLHTKRETLLVFFGGDWRGGRRRMLDHVDAAVKKLAHTLADSRYTSYFKAPQAGVSYKNHCKPEQKAAGCISDNDVRASDSYYERIWTEYATSEFSWQPSGDTPTRRGYASHIRARAQTACTAYVLRNPCQR